MVSPSVNVVLLHDPNDAKQVEEIALWLGKEGGLDVWLERWFAGFDHSGEDRVQNAIAEADCCMIFNGLRPVASWLDGSVIAQIVTISAQKDLRIVPVLLPRAGHLPGESELPRFMRRLEWIEFGKDWRKSEVESLIPGNTEDGRMVTNVCPFPGLSAFREHDSRFFFGRKALIQRLRIGLDIFPFLAVLGPSGSGKSSLVQAGLIPSLCQYGIALFTPGSHPLEELAHALNRAGAVRDTDMESIIVRIAKNERGLHTIATDFRAKRQDKRLLLVVDQFEELFTLTQNELERARFIKALIHAVDRGMVSILICMRSDFIGKCATYPELNTFLAEHLVQLEPMSRKDLRSAIEKPAQMAGLRFENGLVSHILERITGAPGELPLLAHALYELYHEREEQCLTFKAYEEIGGIEGALARRADLEYIRLDSDQKKILRKLFTLCLIHPGEGKEDTRRKASKEELLATGGDRETTEIILRRWTDARLLTSHRDTVRNTDFVDVAHEALIQKWDRIRSWMAEDRETASLLGSVRKAANDWERNGRSPGYLVHGDHLNRFESILPQHAGGLTDLDQDFLSASTRRRRGQTMLKRTAVALLALTAVIAVSFAWWADNLRREKTVEAAKALASADFLTGMFSLPGRQDGEQVSARELLDSGSNKIENSFEDQPEIRASLMDTIGNAYVNLGLYRSAIGLLEKALEIRRDLNRPMVLAESLDNLSKVLYRLSKKKNEPKSDLLKDAEKYLNELLEIHRNRKNPDQLAIADVLMKSGLVLMGNNKLEASKQRFDEGMEILKKFPPTPNHARHMSNFALCLVNLGDLEHALNYNRKALEIIRSIRGEHDRITALLKRELGNTLVMNGRLNEAEPLFDEALAVLKGLGEKKPDYVLTLVDRAYLLQEKGDFEKAKALCLEALDFQMKYQNGNGTQIAQTRNRLGQILMDMNALDEAEDHLRWSWEIIAKEYDPDSLFAVEYQCHFARFLSKKGLFEEAEKHFREALGYLISSDLGETHYLVGQARLELAFLFLRQGETDQAEEQALDAIRIFSDAFSRENWYLAHAESVLGLVYAARGQNDFAESYLIRAHTVLKKKKGPSAKDTVKARERLADFYDRIGKPDKAVRYRNAANTDSGTEKTVSSLNPR